ncbi:MAG: addiction module toxin RelE [Chitinophagaceae bacterium]|nr:addiction module toxin RelE [Chitinophagaceae bacterium]
MTNKVIISGFFASRFKKFKKKFPSINNEITVLIDSLKKNPETGTSLGNGLFKIRLASRSKGKGKSGGFRIITYLIKQTNKGTEIYLLTIYDKAEEGIITKDVLLEIVKRLIS